MHLVTIEALTPGTQIRLRLGSHDPDHPLSRFPVRRNREDRWEVVNNYALAVPPGCPKQNLLAFQQPSGGLIFHIALPSASEVELLPTVTVFAEV